MDLWDEMQGTLDAALIKKIAIITMFIAEGSEGWLFLYSVFCWWRDSSIRAAELNIWAG